MPNWCFTDYTLVGSNEDAKTAYDALHKLEQTKRPGKFETGSYLPNPHWLGYVVEDILGKAWEDIPCRGTFANLELSYKDAKAEITFSTETAWAPCEELVSALAAKFNLSLNFYSEEPGNGYYCKENPDSIYPQTLHYSDDDTEEYFDALAEFIQEHGAKYRLAKDATLQDAMQAVNSSDDGLLIPITDQTSTEERRESRLS